VGRGPATEEKSIVKQLREALRQEEIWMRQRSRVRWLKEGDRNTAYFHAQAAQRKRINKIANLRRLDGSVCVNEAEDKCEVHAFYQNLYTSQGDPLEFVPEKVTMGMNESLTKPFSSEEVREALFRMVPSKAPGVDGFTAGVFQHHWNLVQHKIILAILEFLNGGELPVGLNDSSITLIPMVHNPQLISQY
jgi:hypothetical protein